MCARQPHLLSSLYARSRPVSLIRLHVVVVAVHSGAARRPVALEGAAAAGARRQVAAAEPVEAVEPAFAWQPKVGRTLLKLLLPRLSGLLSSRRHRADSCCSGLVFAADGSASRRVAGLKLHACHQLLWHERLISIHRRLHGRRLSWSLW